MTLGFEDRCLDEFYKILRLAWTIPEAGLPDNELLAIEDGPLEVPEDDDAADGLEPARDPEPAHDDVDMEAGEEEAGEVDDPTVEPSDPYVEKATAVLPKSPQLDVHEDSQVVKASSAESLGAATPPKAPTTPPKPPTTAAGAPNPVLPLTRRQHVCTPKKLFQEEPSPTPDLAAAREIMRKQLRQILGFCLFH